MENFAFASSRRTHSTHGRDERCIQILVGNPEVKRPYRRPRRTWEDNIRMDLKEIGC
jgi:hypothetical protein